MSEKIHNYIFWCQSSPISAGLATQWFIQLFSPLHCFPRRFGLVSVERAADSGSYSSIPGMPVGKQVIMFLTLLYIHRKHVTHLSQGSTRMIYTVSYNTFWHNPHGWWGNKFCKSFVSTVFIGQYSWIGEPNLWDLGLSKNNRLEDW